MPCLRSDTAEVHPLIASVKAPWEWSGHGLKTSHVRLWLKLLIISEVRLYNSCKELAIVTKSFGLYAGTLLVVQLAQVFAKSFMKQRIDQAACAAIFFSMMVEWHCQRKILTLRILKFYRPCCILTDWHKGPRISSVDSLWRVCNYWQKHLDLCQNLHSLS